MLGDGQKSYMIIDKRLGTANRIIKLKNSESLTVIEYVSAVSTSIPPLIIYKGENLQSH
jgi:hypothetical protein